jgi:hypothetical protein
MPSEGRAGIDAQATERRDVRDHRSALADKCDIRVEYAFRYAILMRKREFRVEGKHADQSVIAAMRLLHAPDVDRIGEENVGPRQINGRHRRLPMDSIE